MGNKAPYILVCAAVVEEVAGLKTRMNQMENGTAGFAGQTLSGRIGGMEVTLLVTGPGMVNASHALTAVIERHRPGLIIQTGCAGAFEESGLRIGDIGVATEEIDVQLGLESLSGDQLSLLCDLPFPVLKTDAGNFFSRYPVDDKWTCIAYDRLNHVLKTSDVHIRKGPFITVSTITATDARAKQLYDTYHACMEQMEGSAAAHVAAGYRIPFVEIRSVANRVGHRDRKNWNLSLSYKNISMAVYEFIQIIKF